MCDKSLNNDNFQFKDLYDIFFFLFFFFFFFRSKVRGVHVRTTLPRLK